MSDWKTLHPYITEVVQKLPNSSFLAIRNNAALMQFASLDLENGSVLRAEVCRDSPEDEPRLRSNGWELVDPWSGLWRREIPMPVDGEAVEALVLEAINAMRFSFGIKEPEGFTYLSWQEAPRNAGWQFWKSRGDKDLKWPELSIRKGKDHGD